MQLAEPAGGVGARGDEKRGELVLDDGEPLQHGARLRGRAGKREREGGAGGARLGELLPAALGRERALILGAREQVQPGLHELRQPAICCQASRSSPRSSETRSIMFGSRSMRASMR